MLCCRLAALSGVPDRSGILAIHDFYKMDVLLVGSDLTGVPVLSEEGFAGADAESSPESKHNFQLRFNRNLYHPCQPI